MNKQKYEDAIKALDQMHRDALAKHGAIEMVAGYEYVGYIIEEESGYSVDVWSWGVNHGKIYGATIDEVRRAVHDRYDGPIIRQQIHSEVEKMDWPEVVNV